MFGRKREFELLKIINSLEDRITALEGRTKDLQVPIEYPHGDLAAALTWSQRPGMPLHAAVEAIMARLGLEVHEEPEIPRAFKLRERQGQVKVNVKCGRS